MNTRITRLFGIKHPVLLAGMAWITDPKFVAAVSNAGGLGNLAISSYTPENIRSYIREIRKLTDKPFAINQALLSPTAKANLAVVIDEKVPIVNYHLGRPAEIAPLVEAVHGYGGKVMATVALVKHAIRAEQLGVDAITMTGHEAAGHGGEATSLVLIPIVARKIKIPISASGGFFDGRGLAAALVLGADAVTMGCRFMMTQESPLHEKWRKTIINASEQDTIYLDYGDPTLNSRVLKNKKAEAEMKKRFPLITNLSAMTEIKRTLQLSWADLLRSGLSTRKGEGGLSLREQLQYAAGVARGKRSMIEGDENAQVFIAGQSIGGIKDIPSCQELIERTVMEAAQALESVKERLAQ